MAFNPYLLAHEMSIPVEAKNVSCGHKTPAETRMEAVKQCIGHLAKRTLVAFNLGGVSINLKSIALAMTPVYLEVITMTCQEWKLATCPWMSSDLEFSPWFRRLP